jgi:hypothetical protein
MLGRRSSDRRALPVWSCAERAELYPFSDIDRARDVPIPWIRTLESRSEEDHMSSRRVALVGSWPQRYIDDHRRWLDQHGAHSHGWSNPLSPANRTLVETTIGAHGHINFYAYMSLGQGGGGTVRYRLALSDFEYHWPGVPFEHEHGDHGSPGPSTAVLIFSLTAVEELPEAHQITDFMTVAGKTLSRRAMRGLYVVDERAAAARSSMHDVAIEASQAST